jgi:HEAT repeat protein
MKAFAAYAALDLGRIAVNEEVVVPALMKLLQSTNPVLRNCSAVGLMGFGTKAKNAAPALAKLLDDPAHKIRVSATNALERIAPELLEARALSPAPR